MASIIIFLEKGMALRSMIADGDMFLPLVGDEVVLDDLGARTVLSRSIVYKESMQHTLTIHVSPPAAPSVYETRGVRSF